MGMKFWQRFWQHWRKDLSLRLLALAAAIALWFYVSSEPASLKQSATSFVQAIPEVEGVGADVEISPLPYVTVELEGPKEELAKVKAENLLYVNLSNLSSGTHHVKVRRRLPGKVRVVSLKPSLIKVQLKQLTQIGIAVSVEVPNQVASEAVVTPKQVYVKGTSQQLKQVSQAVVRAEGEQGQGAVLILDKAGRALPLEVEPATVKYQVKLSEPIISKLVPVHNPGQVSFTPSQVRLWGREEELEKIEEVQTEPLPQQEREGEVSVVMPQGVYAIEPEKVTFILE